MNSHSWQLTTIMFNQTAVREGCNFRFLLTTSKNKLLTLNIRHSLPHLLSCVVPGGIDMLMFGFFYYFRREDIISPHLFFNKISYKCSTDLVKKVESPHCFL